MNVSDTPRTDALYAGMPMPPALSPATREALDFARQLERELAESERQNKELREVPQQSERYRQMMEAAEAYFRLLRESGPSAAGVDAAEARLNELAAPFSDDPAFQALLKLECESQRGGGGDGNAELLALLKVAQSGWGCDLSAAISALCCGADEEKLARAEFDDWNYKVEAAIAKAEPK